MSLHQHWQAEGEKIEQKIIRNTSGGDSTHLRWGPGRRVGVAVDCRVGHGLLFIRLGIGDVWWPRWLWWRSSGLLSVEVEFSVHQSLNQHTISPHSVEQRRCNRKLLSRHMTKKNEYRPAGIAAGAYSWGGQCFYLAACSNCCSIRHTMFLSMALCSLKKDTGMYLIDPVQQHSTTTLQNRSLILISAVLITRNSTSFMALLGIL